MRERGYYARPLRSSLGRSFHPDTFIGGFEPANAMRFTPYPQRGSYRGASRSFGAFRRTSGPIVSSAQQHGASPQSFIEDGRGDYIWQSLSNRSSIFFLKVKGLSFSITKEGGCGGVGCGGHL
ncbi:hypothetical protein DPMN_113260 [Dreissena polymorpha]|uniref:Uncharacterized protein n=1 Tax=Dreissena polymorpha TaxID=45954 RepID=A0A9D4KHZ3_DREPO|nr:hypothetical protein DPMN_113260 [Dreissena polymorpha]